MSESNINTRYLMLITLVATLGGLLFGYDTAVISGTTGALENFFITPLFGDDALSNSVISEFKIVATVCFSIVAVVFVGLFKKLFENNILQFALISVVVTGLIVVIDYMEYLSQPGTMNEALGNSIKGFVISSALFGCIIGGGMAGVIGQKYGRKSGLILSAILFAISALGSAIPEDINFSGGTVMTSFVIYRIIGGIGVGMASMLSPMYIAEIAPASVRGKMVSWNQFSIIFGMLLVYFVNYFIAQGQSEAWINDTGWRYMFASELIPAGLFFTMLFLIPESPRYLVAKNQDGKASKILSRIMGNERAGFVVNEIKGSMTTTTKPWLSFGAAVIIIGVLLSAFQQFVGINVVLYYAPEIFKTLGSNTDSSLMQTIIVGAINLIFTVLAIFTVDKLGRKKLQVIGALTMAFSMFLLGTTFYLDLGGYIALTAMLLYVAGFAMSWGPVTWVLLSEIFPNSIKGALALAVAVQWFTNYLVSWTFPMMNESSYLTEQFNHGFSYWIYGIMGVLAAFFVGKFVPETKGKTLEEIESLWKK